MCSTYRQHLIISPVLKNSKSLKAEVYIRRKLRDLFNATVAFVSNTNRGFDWRVRRHTGRESIRFRITAVSNLCS